MDAIDAIDQMPQGKPETVVTLPRGQLLGLKIRGVLGNLSLGIRADEYGRPETCAVMDAIYIDTDEDGA